MKDHPIKIATKLHNNGYKVKNMAAVLTFEREGMEVDIIAPESDAQVVRLLNNIDKNGKT